MKTKIWYSLKRNEMQFYDKSVAVKAFKKGLNLYATRGLNTSQNVDDYKLTSVDAIIDIEQALFIVENVNIVEASAFIKEVNK
jgi:hypothetical protein